MEIPVTAGVCGGQFIRQQKLLRVIIRPKQQAGGAAGRRSGDLFGSISRPAVVPAVPAGAPHNKRGFEAQNGLFRAEYRNRLLGCPDTQFQPQGSSCISRRRCWNTRRGVAASQPTSVLDAPRSHRVAGSTPYRRCTHDRRDRPRLLLPFDVF